MAGVSRVASDAQPPIPFIAFPDHDRLWTEPLDFVKARWPASRCLAPVEFCNRLPQALPYAWSFWQSPADFALVILHKGQLPMLKASFLQRCLQELRYVFGNEVFCVFVAPALSDGLGVGPPLHLLLAEKLQVLRQTVRRAWHAWKGEGLRCLIVSARGMGNLGDDSVAHAAGLLLSEALPGCELQHGGPPPRRELVEWADLVVLGGGGLLYDACYYNARNYTQFLLWARELDRPAFCLGIGTQGIRSALGRELFRRALDGLCAVHVRSQRDAQVLREDVGVTAPIEQGQDLAFALPVGPRLRQAPYARPLLYFALLDAEKMRAARSLRLYMETTRTMFPELEQRFEIACVVQSEDDADFYRSLPRTRPLRLLRPDPGTAVEAYQQADLVLTSRFHGLVFAALAGTPVIAVSSAGTKIHSLIQDGLPGLQASHIDIRQFGPAQLLAKLALFETDPARLTALPAEVDGCRALARSAIETLRRHLPARGTP